MDQVGQYFRVEREDNDSFPLLDWGENALPYIRSKPLRDLRVVRLVIGEPVPDSVQMVDYHPLPQPVFHDRLKPCFDGSEQTKCQLVRVSISDAERGKEYFDYFLIHAYNKVSCAHLEKSEYKYISKVGTMYGIENLVLDSSKLGDIPLEERMIMRPSETGTMVIFHEIIIKKIQSMKPIGCRFSEVCIE